MNSIINLMNITASSVNIHETIIYHVLQAHFSYRLESVLEVSFDKIILRNASFIQVVTLLDK